MEECDDQQLQDLKKKFEEKLGREMSSMTTMISLRLKNILGHHHSNDFSKPTKFLPLK